MTVLEKPRRIGTPTPLVDGFDKVTGRAKYTADLPAAGALVGRILRSPIPHGVIRGIDTSEAERLPGVIYRPPDGTYLAWLDLRALDLPGPAGEFVKERAGVIVNDGAAFGEPGAGFIRLNLATARPILTEIVDRIAGAVAGCAPSGPPAPSATAAGHAG